MLSFLDYEMLSVRLLSPKFSGKTFEAAAFVPTLIVRSHPVRICAFNILQEISSMLTRSKSYPFEDADFITLLHMLQTLEKMVKGIVVASNDSSVVIYALSYFK